MKEVGYITSYFSGIAKIQGLTRVFPHEILINESGDEIGIVIGFNENFIEALLFSEDLSLDLPVLRSEKIFSIPVSDAYLMRVVDGLGKPLDGLPPISGESSSIFQNAPQIIDRTAVSQPLLTGIKIIDAVLPLGRGQRELIIGDRKLGKSTIAIDTVLNQRNVKDPVYCVYVLIGQKQRQLEDLLAVLNEYNAFSYTTIIAASASDTMASQYLAPLVGCRIAEYFRDQGKHALVIYDDLSKHAKVYRNIALLLERAPGREAYPGDIFSLHASLLERAGKLSKENGGGSITALPIVETQEGDITSYIPTNIISITDGQIYLERGLFQRGFIPAINIGRSISRIGSEAQPALLSKATSGLRLLLSQQRELQKISQLETMVSEESKLKVKLGLITLELLKQEKHKFASWQEQAILFTGIQRGIFDEIQAEQLRQFQILFYQLIRTRYSGLADLDEVDEKNEVFEEFFKKIISDFRKEFITS
jgi:F-type H+-transporting ATPase subunit alpha